jgi:hypothetical protein
MNRTNLETLIVIHFVKNGNSRVQDRFHRSQSFDPILDFIQYTILPAFYQRLTSILPFHEGQSCLSS